MQEKMTLVGHYTIQNKEKTKQFFIVQCLKTSSIDKTGIKSNILNIFVPAETYAEVAALDYSSEILVESTINYDKSSVSYKIIL